MIAPLIVPCTPELLADVVADMREGSATGLANSPAFAALALAPASRAWAMVAPGRVLAAAGLVPHWHGRAEGWLIVARSCSKRELVHGLRRARTMLDDLQTDSALRRIEIYVRASVAWCRSFPAALGFAEEASLAAWGPDGGDFRLCARVRRI